MDKFLKISDIRKFTPDQSIWVLNTTNSCPSLRRNIDPDTGKYKQERADVVINITSTSGNHDRETIVVPQSFLPIDCTDYVTREDLMSSHQFLKLVREGFLTLISEEYAEQLFETDGANKERERLAELQQRVVDANNKRGITKAEVLNISNPNDNEQKVAMDQADADDGFDQTFVANVLKWTQMDSTSLINDMKVSGKFSRKELHYVLTKLDAVKHKDAIEHIQRILAKTKKSK